MTATAPSAWLKSIMLHAAIAGLIMLYAYTAALNSEKPTRILELVAGPGDDYTATAAPALGDPNSVKLPLSPATPAPTPPAPTPPVATPPVTTPVQRAPETSPVVPAPVPVKKEAPKTTPKQPAKEPDPAKNIAKDIKSQIARADQKAKRQAAAERKKEQDRITKEEFDRKNAERKVAAANAAKTGPTKYKPIDTKGIVGGVAGGSVESTKGAGGKALTREEGTLLELYYSDFRQKLRASYEADRPPGLSDSLRVTIEVRSNPDGSLTNLRIMKSSGTPEFDRAVLEAVRRVRMQPRPDKKPETISFVFTMSEE